MKRDKIIYWVFTSLLSLGLVSAGFTYLTDPTMTDRFRHYGFPGYFQIELGAAKIAGALVLILPAVPPKVKRWAYTGVAIVFVSAFIAHLSVDGISTTLTPIIAFCLWAVSAFFFNRVNPGTLEAR